jgi:hypothetical protein
MRTRRSGEVSGARIVDAEPRGNKIQDPHDELRGIMLGG